MAIVRLHGTPDSWQPSPRTDRYTRRNSVFGTFVMALFALATLGFAAVIAAEAVRELFVFRELTFVPWLIVLVSGGIGAFLAWLVWGEVPQALRFLELDWRKGRLLAFDVDGIAGAPHVMTPSHAIGRFGMMMTPRSLEIAFDDLEGLVIAPAEQRTVVVGQRGGVLETRVQAIEKLIAMPQGAVIYVDTAIFGKVRTIADALSRAVKIPVTVLEPERPVPLPPSMPMGTKVALHVPGRGRVVGYVSAATTKGAASPAMPNLIVVLAHGGNVSVPPFEVTRIH